MDFRKLAQKALDEAKTPKKKLNETIRYAEGHNERMHPQLERELRERKHSLGDDHPCLPTGDEVHFEQQIMGDVFEEIMKNYKSKFDVQEIDERNVLNDQMGMVYECMAVEAEHKGALEKLAVEMIRKEYNMSEDMVEITAELTDKISLEGTEKEASPIMVEMEFDNHDSIKQAKDQVYKRRFLNAMTQGAAKKSSHMFHMADKELSNLDPTLSNKYGKIMASADYSYYIIPEMHNQINGGVVRVTLPSEENPKCHIHAQGMVFPVLIHELCKGVMEIFSAHGLPEDEKLTEYVMGKSDFLAAESWDMKLGRGLWDRFTSLIPSNDFGLKHNVYSKLAGLPVQEFNYKMREIMAHTKEGSSIIQELLDEVKGRIKEDNYSDTIRDDDSEGFSLGDLEGIDIDDIK